MKKEENNNIDKTEKNPSGENYHKVVNAMAQCIKESPQRRYYAWWLARDLGGAHTTRRINKYLDIAVKRGIFTPHRTPYGLEYTLVGDTPSIPTLDKGRAVTRWDIRECFADLRTESGEVTLSKEQQEELFDLVERFYRRGDPCVPPSQG